MGTYQSNNLQWVPVDKAIFLNNNLRMRASFKIQDKVEDLVVIAIDSRDRKISCEGFLSVGEGFDASKLAGVIIAPRAVKPNRNGGVDKILIEFIPSRKSFWVNEYLQ